MESILSLGLPLIQQLISSTTLTSPLISGIVGFLGDAVPLVIKEYKDLTPIVSNIIKAVKSDPATNVSDLSTLEQYEAIIDADFEDAATKALDEDGNI